VSHSARAFHRHAREVLEHELRRARGQLGSLPRERRLVVEEVATRVATALVEGVLDQARGEPALAQTLLAIYGADGVPAAPGRLAPGRLESRRGS
jgi:hypothetical protein